jgi:hypothetical protein
MISSSSLSLLRPGTDSLMSVDLIVQKDSIDLGSGLRRNVE